MRLRGQLLESAIASHLNFLQGLGPGGMIAAIALGIVLTYRASGVVNFAHAAIGMYIAFAYYELRASGDLILPLIGLPAKISVVDRPTVFTALLVIVLLSIVLGALFYLLIFRRLRNSPPLARVIATVGLFLYLIGIVDVRFPDRGAANLVLIGPLPDDVVRWGDITTSTDRLAVAGLVLVVALVLTAIYQFTRFGIATRAAAENERGALLLGLSPHVIGVVNWALATVLAGLVVILVAPRTPFDPISLSLLVVPALAAALVGRLESFTITAIAGLAIGLAQREISNLEADWPWLPDVGLEWGVPFVLIIVLMMVRGETILGRGTVGGSGMPAAPDVPRAPITAAVVGAAAIVAMLTTGSEWRLGIIVSAIAMIVSLSVIVVTGFVGQISMAQYTFAGISAFAMVRLTEGLNLPFPIAPICAALIATVAAILVGFPAVRVRGMNLAIVTLATAVAVEELVFKWEWFTGGLTGSQIERPTLWGVDFGVFAPGDAFPRRIYGVLVVIIAMLFFIAVANLRRGVTGVRWLAVRSNERAAAAVGIDVARAKLTAFAAGGFIAGIAGALLAYQQSILTTSSFMVLSSLTVLATTYLAGISSPNAAILAGLITTSGVLTVLLGRDSSDTQFAVNGLLLILTALLYPSGITGAARDLWARIRGTNAPPRAPIEPDESADLASLS